MSLLAAKEWILDYEVGVFWVTMRVLACGGVGVIAWEALTGQLARKRAIEVRNLCLVLPLLLLKAIQWPVLGIASLLLFVQHGCLFTALFRLSPIRYVSVSVPRIRQVLVLLPESFFSLSSPQFGWMH